MSDTVISVESLSKSYLVGHEGPRERYHSLRDSLVRHGKNYVRKAVDMARGRQIIQGDNVEEFWALKDVSFEVRRGEVLGIIGRNGAGKSTLLKILSRITEPTCGRVTLHGRIASLLEVGTGFHPELSGRENIFLNGAILGMKKAEIRGKFDEIVDFAEVERFLDTPVKRYSSGMYVRLAFAVAAHLEPEILIVDEVLAVGDANFQKKCLGKMQEVAVGGRTVLFVSHNMAAVQSLCSRAVLLRAGELQKDGEIIDVIPEYIKSTDRLKSITESEPFVLENELKLTRFVIHPISVFSGSAVRFQIIFHSPARVHLSELAILIYSQAGVRVGIIDLRGRGVPVTIDAGDSWEISVSIQSFPLVEGLYSAGIYLNTGSVADNFLDLVELTVCSSLLAKDRTIYPASVRGFIELDCVEENLQIKFPCH
jgi:lipopolysaccharide transport system ATP-binding protein